MDPKLQEQLNTILDDADVAVKFLDIQSASSALAGIARIIEAKPEGVDQSTIQKFNWYIPRLQFVQFDSLSDRKAIDLLKLHTDALFDIPSLDLFDLIHRRLEELTYFYDQTVNHLSDLIVALQTSGVLIGKVKILVSGNRVDQTIENWLKDYLAFPQQSRPYRVNIDEVNYSNKSENGRSLGIEDRDHLMVILKIYDTLRNTLVYYQNLPEAEEGEDPWEGFDARFFEPGYTDEVDNEETREKESIVSTAATSSDTEQSSQTRGSAVQPMSMSDITKVQTDVSYEAKPSAEVQSVEEVLAKVAPEQPLGMLSKPSGLSLQDSLLAKAESVKTLDDTYGSGLRMHGGVPDEVKPKTPRSVVVDDMSGIVSPPEPKKPTVSPVAPPPVKPVEPVKPVGSMTLDMIKSSSAGQTKPFTSSSALGQSELAKQIIANAKSAKASVVGAGESAPDTEVKSAVPTPAISKPVEPPKAAPDPTVKPPDDIQKKLDDLKSRFKV